jgi:hypothetical protein
MFNEFINKVISPKQIIDTLKQAYSTNRENDVKSKFLIVEYLGVNNKKPNNVINEKLKLLIGKEYSIDLEKTLKSIKTQPSDPILYFEDDAELLNDTEVESDPEPEPIRVPMSLLLERLNKYANIPGEVRETSPLFEMLELESEPKITKCEIFAQDKDLFNRQKKGNEKQLENIDRDLNKVDGNIKNVQQEIELIEDEMKQKNCPTTKGGQAKDDKSYFQDKYYEDKGYSDDKSYPEVKLYPEDKMLAQDEKLSQNDCETIKKKYDNLEEHKEELIKEETELIEKEEGLLAFKEEIQKNIKEINIKINEEPSCNIKGGKRKTRKRNKKHSSKKRSSKRKASSKKRKATRRRR